MKAAKHPVALVPPAVAKWQFVEEKARAVLDSHCHREVRPPLLEPLAGRDAMGVFAQAFVTHMPWQSDPVTRWYSMGAAFRAETGPFGWQQGHEIAAVLLGLPGPSAEAELYAMAGTLLRECGLPASHLRLTLFANDRESPDHQQTVVDLLTELGHHPHRAPAQTGHELDPGITLQITLNRVASPAPAPLLLCRGRRHDQIIAHLGGPDTPAACWSIDLGQIVAALDDADEGYQAPVSLLIAPTSPAARRRALPLAQRLRAVGIRTEVEHREIDAEGALALERATRLGARLVVLVPDAPGDDVVTLVDLTSGQRRPIGADDLEVRVAQLLD
jgi:histidyl-tRNA synthetase